jgi:hypothetical protein
MLLSSCFSFRFLWKLRKCTYSVYNLLNMLFRTQCYISKIYPCRLCIEGKNQYPYHCYIIPHCVIFFSVIGIELFIVFRYFMQQARILLLYILPINCAVVHQGHTLQGSFVTSWNMSMYNFADRPLFNEKQRIFINKCCMYFHWLVNGCIYLNTDFIPQNFKVFYFEYLIQL